MVSNSGDRAGAEVVQLYLSDPVAQVARPVTQLCGYARVDLEPGQCARVTFRLHADRTIYTDRQGRRIVEPGDIHIGVGASSKDLRLRAILRIGGELRTPRRPVLRTPVTVIQS